MKVFFCLKPNLQKCWEHGWGGVRAPLGCCLLMILIICMAFIGESKYMELHLETLQDVWAGHRLFTHILCTPDPSLLLLSLFLLPLLCWQIEEYLGTLQFLQLSCLCTLCTGTLYLLLSWLLPSPTVPASGYLATQLAFMTIYWLVLQGRSHTKLTPLLLCGILIITELLCTHCPFLLHICGIIIGMTLRYRLLTFLKLTESHRKMLEKSNVFHYLASVPFVKCVPSKGKDTLLPVIDSRDTLLPVIDSRAHERLPFPHAVLPQSATFNDITWGELSSDTWLHDGLRDMPPASLLMESEELEEQLLSASIQASLREYRKEEPETQEYALQKSSVSALRLQQLERMGFPTGPAVLALAATGKVERAVSLLVEGQVGADIRVTSEKPATQRHCGPPEQAHTCDVTENSH